MKRSPFLLLFFSYLLISCGSNYSYWDVSKFKMDKSALSDSEEIKLIYSSRGPDFNENLDYYVHLICISQESGDTVNILTTSRNDLKSSDGDRVFHFFDEDNIMTKMSRMNQKGAGEINHVDDLDKLEPLNIKKVARDPEFDEIADNDYPTVIGSIGTIGSIK